MLMMMSGIIFYGIKINLNDFEIQFVSVSTHFFAYKLLQFSVTLNLAKNRDRYSLKPLLG